ncbi:uncharacterized protein J8A68_000204 [[Candida] subhashii]|uniref:DASH complex subunit DUO1 n=1 Tax=[Candida] subhashii TaxID=561895 RepID=A0A8J5QTH7_9ASCO|nr:uncharacterized protein J8A68_000204 [[Candida] subhashii]KAG7666251.1 hypothetical protein J8A68_000204 [[Candida] subhashii]
MSGQYNRFSQDRESSIIFTPRRSQQPSQEPDVELALRNELTKLTEISASLQSAVSTIKTINKNITTMNNANEGAIKLLDKYTNILSESTFTHDMIDNEDWKPQELDANDSFDEENYENEEEDLLKRLNAIEGENDSLKNRVDKILNEKQARAKRMAELTGVKRTSALGGNVSNPRRKVARTGL